MNVLMITGDRSFGPGHPRFELQKNAVEKLAVVYWGRGSLWPTLPAGSFDVVTAQDPFWRGLFAWYAARRIGASLNVQVHADLAGQSSIKRLLAHIVLCRADSVRVVSEKIKKQVERVGVRVPIAVLPVFVDVERFRNLKRQPQKKKKTIVWIGRFEEEKDPEEALSLFKIVRDAGIDASLVMLGAGSERELLLKSAHQLEYRDDIEFPGWQDPLSYISMADVVISTSKYESWGASIVEALAAGVPVVAPDVGIAREAGAIVVDDQTDLAEAVINVLRSGAPGELAISLPTPEEWQKRWRETLSAGRVKA